MTDTATSSPLAGIRVLDLSRLLPGPFCTQVLVDLGADVIRIEDHDGGDIVRHQPPLAADSMSLLFHALNRGKRAVALDLRNADDREAFFGLCADADVVVESFRPGVMARLGLAPAALLARFPRLVVCSISGYGQHGPLAQRAGHDVNYLARSGALSLMKTPTVLPVQVADLAGGAWPAAAQICAALFARERTGNGAIIDVSMTDGLIALLSMTIARTLGDDDGDDHNDNAVDGGRELLVGRVPCYAVYPTRDGFLAVGALEPKFWSAVCAVIDRPDLVTRGWDHGDDGAEVAAILTGIFTREDTATWRARFADVDACVEPVLTSREAFAAARSVDVVVGDRVVALPTTGLSLGAPASTKAPLPGEHTAAILGRRR